MLTVKSRLYDTYKRITIPRCLVESFNRMRFVVLKEYDLLEESNLKDVYDYETILDDSLINYTSKSTWDFQKMNMQFSSNEKSDNSHSIEEYYYNNSKSVVVKSSNEQNINKYNKNSNDLKTLHVWYIDVITKDYLEITNDINCKRAIENAHHNSSPLYLIIILNDCLRNYIPFKCKKRFQIKYKSNSSSILQSVKLHDNTQRKNGKMIISTPNQFKHLSSIIDSEHLPASIIRVKIYKYGDESRALGFYIREGIPDDINSSGIYISRIIPNSLAALTGVMQVNDQILEVNGIDVLSKSIDQVCDMISANSYHLILTLKSQNYYLLKNEYDNKVHKPKIKSNFNNIFANNIYDDNDSDSVIDV